MKRRDFLAIATVVAFIPAKAPAAAEAHIEVYKSPSCGCCGKWAEHLRQSGFSVSVNEISDLPEFRTRSGISKTLASCHTAIADGYVVEGHVPASDIWSLLRNRPKALGLAVPGMPSGSPGMDAPHAEPYDVLLVQADGTTRVFRSYPRT
jgi:hypothetical protein